MSQSEPFPRNELRLAIEIFVKLTVDHTEDVFVELTEKPNGVVINVHCSPDETGKLIGKAGRTARSWRIVLLGIRRKYGCEIELNFPSTVRER